MVVVVMVVMVVVVVVVEKWTTEMGNIGTYLYIHLPLYRPEDDAVIRA